jgi:hypothetical protein
MNDRQLFGPASTCQDLEELIQLQRGIVGDEARHAVAAYGMLVAARSAPGGGSYDDALEVLNYLGGAKATLDKAANHSKPTVSVTAEILASAQIFVDEATIPCTEWPSSAEVVDRVFKSAAKYAFDGPWERIVFGSKGEVIGIEEFYARGGA